MFSIHFKSNRRAQRANQSKAVYSSEKVPPADHVAPWPEPNKGAGSWGEQNPSERALNLSVYAIITAANEAADQALTTAEKRTNHMWRQVTSTDWCCLSEASLGGGIHRASPACRIGLFPENRLLDAAGSSWSATVTGPTQRSDPAHRCFENKAP